MGGADVTRGEREKGKGREWESERKGEAEKVRETGKEGFRTTHARTHARTHVRWADWFRRLLAW
jgi:hypothetical protein